jgi:hypothetical protein
VIVELKEIELDFELMKKRELSPEHNDFVNQWESDWFCYWDDSFCTPPPNKREETFVFRPSLLRLKCGVLMSGRTELPLDDDLKKDAAIAKGLAELCKNEVAQWGSECDYPFLGLIIPWRPEFGEFTLLSIAASLGMHPEISKNLSGKTRESSPIFDHICDCVELDGEMIFVIGTDGSMNPLPVVVLRRSVRGNLVGLVSAVVYT